MDKQLKPQLRFPEFSDNWIAKKLNNLGIVVNGLTYSPNDIDDNGVLVLRSSNIQNNQLTFEDNVYVKSNDFNEVLEDDILICVRNGSKRLIGKNVLIPKAIEGVAFGAFMSVYRSKYNKFIFQLFATETYQKTIYENLGATINSINNSEIKKFQFNFPSILEQQKIASFLSDVDAKITQLTKKKDLLEQYKKGVMQKIFSQELRFKDDNGNEFPKWEVKKLGDVCLKKSSNISANSLEKNNGEYNIYGATGFLQKVNFYDEEIEYIGIVKDGSGVGNNFLAEKYSSVLGTIDKIFPKKSINIYFLKCLLDRIHFEKYKVGSSIPHIYFKDYSIENILIPCIGEQTKIANFLSDIDLKIEALNTKIENSKSFKKGLLQQMFV